MAHFFFHFRNGAEYVEDEEGSDLASTDAVRAHGIEALRAILADDVHAGVMNTASFVEIEDANHRRVMKIVVEDVVRFEHDLFSRTGGKPPPPVAGIISGNDD